MANISVTAEVFFSILVEMCAEEANPIPTCQDLQEAENTLIAIGHGMRLKDGFLVSEQYLQRATAR